MNHLNQKTASGRERRDSKDPKTKENESLGGEKVEKSTSKNEKNLHAIYSILI